MPPIQRPNSDIGHMPQLRPICALLLTSLAGWQSNANADDGTPAPFQIAQIQSTPLEFESGFLNNSGGGVDLSKFERSNVVPPGTYSVDIYVDQNWVGRASVPFKAVAGTADAQPCFNEALLKQAGVNLGKLPHHVKAAFAEPDACVRLGQAIPDASSSFDFGEQRLNLSIPQIALVRNARGYVSPDQWDAGVPVGMLGYNANVYSSKSQGSHAQTQGYLGLNVGVNMGGWHFRHDGSYSLDDKGRQKYQNVATYLQRSLPSLSSQLVIGESYTSGDLFDSTQFRGVRISTDDRMLPDSLRGYAPVVRGVANSNAKVSISQNGVKLYETTVAPGAFEIDDLYPTGYGGDLHVAVTEADGSVHSFSVPYAAVPLSLRPGTSRYSVVAGTVRNQQSSKNPLFTQGTWQHGFTNLLTGYGGITVAEGYVSVMAGGVLNTTFGAFGGDVTHARTSIPGVKRFDGSSVRVSYAKNVVATGTNVSIAAYRYSTAGYFGLNDAMLARDQAERGLSIDTVYRQRNRASLTLNQRLGERGGNINATASTATYWNRSGSDVSYSVGYSNAYKNLGYSVSATRQRNSGGQMSTLYYVGLTIPLGGKTPMTMTGNMLRDTAGRTQLQSSVSGAAGVDNNFSYGLNANHANGNGSSTTTGGANVMYRAPNAELSASVSGGADYQQASVSARGAMVAHPGGITLSQPLSETFAIVEAPGAEGARVTNASGVRIDSRGYAIVPYLTPFNMNMVELDPKGLSTDVELKETSQSVAPLAGSAPMLKFATESGRSALIQPRRPNGKPLPFGASVVNEQGKEVGSVGQMGKIFARGLESQGELTVRWGKDESSVCHVPYTLPERKKNKGLQPLQRIDAACADSAPRPNYAANQPRR
ncbi:fimbrial protein [Cupriavidus sp. SK-3]|uniref:fimbria/pilus outer membrane usher protein n=1 Tax=Cupriavidus sp. SK-3 TaxID=1470558 RepID=UPI000448822E|nr:fimbria/pilus outer membrane usher protein [Cupriavidus sp. SK-3]KDP86738.1 fimbrial protein [Cupriavidus sp. SK-3]